MDHLDTLRSLLADPATTYWASIGTQIIVWLYAGYKIMSQIATGLGNAWAAIKPSPGKYSDLTKALLNTLEGEVVLDQRIGYDPRLITASAEFIQKDCKKPFEIKVGDIMVHDLIPSPYERKLINRKARKVFDREIAQALEKRRHNAACEVLGLKDESKPSGVPILKPNTCSTSNLGGAPVVWANKKGQA